MIGSIHMGWRHVLFANWPAEPAVVEPHVPDRMTLDTFDGEAWLSVVPFTNVDVRPARLPAGWGVGLPELNLRTYVTVDDEPGVYFFSLDAQGILGVLGARLFHHLPYYYARIDLAERDDGIRFASRRRHPGARPAEFRATYEPAGESFTAEPGSIEAFLTDRHRYYTESQGGDLRYAAVHHDPWPLFPARASFAENSLFAANGFAHPGTDPIHLYSPGVDTIASASKRSELVLAPERSRVRGVHVRRSPGSSARVTTSVLMSRMISRSSARRAGEGDEEDERRGEREGTTDYSGGASVLIRRTVPGSSGSRSTAVPCPG